MSDSDPVQPIDQKIPDIKPPEPITPPAPGGGIKGIEGAAPAPGKELRNKEAKPYFLAEESSKDRMKARFPARDIVSVTPLIDGVAIFSELEKAISGAKSSVLLAYWAINFSTKMVTDSSRTWADMLIAAAKSGVKVRVLINDFDPGFQGPQHANAWLQHGETSFRAIGKEKISPDLFQIVVSRHPAEVPAKDMAIAGHDKYDTIAGDLNSIGDMDKRMAIYLYSPGLWDKITADPKNAAMSPATAHKTYPACPASHHQKLAIIDGTVALTGGLNVVELYVDSEKHDRKVDTQGLGPWHDAYVKIEGAGVIRDLVTNYIGLWNQGKIGMDVFLTTQKALLKTIQPYYSKLTTTLLTESDITIGNTSKTTAPSLPAQIRRTVSTAGTTFPYFANTRKDVLEGYLLAISLAEQFIYIENQYLREKEIGKAIIAQHGKKADLRTIIVLPTRSEELVRNTGDAISKHGAALQLKIIDDMQKQIGSNLGVFALERKDKVLVYVHSKLLMVDDKFASIGSANTNPRSMLMDTELDFVWFDATTVSALRLQLWKEILGAPKDLAAWKTKDFVKNWSKIADSNKTARASKLKGFVRTFVNDAKGELSLLVDLGPYS